jgi:hypothetical protein
MMKEITAFRCSDGSIHSDEKKAQAHEDDLLGQELDGFLRLFELDITRNQEFKGILCAMKKRPALLEAAKLIVNILEDNHD